MELELPFESLLCLIVPFSVPRPEAGGPAKRQTDWTATLYGRSFDSFLWIVVLSDVTDPDNRMKGKAFLPLNTRSASRMFVTRRKTVSLNSSSFVRCMTAWYPILLQSLTFMTMLDPLHGEFGVHGPRA